MEKKQSNSFLKFIKAWWPMVAIVGGMVAFVVFIVLITTVIPDKIADARDARIERAEKIVKAIEDGNFNYVRVQIERGENIDIKDYYDRTLLITAVLADEYDIAQYLIENGANVNAKDDSGNNAFMHAAEKGYYKMVQLLLDNGTRINIQDKTYRMTALMKALDEQHFDIVHILLENGANINKINYQGENVLHIAVRLFNIDLVKIFVQRGIDINRQSKELKETPLMIATRSGNLPICKFLIENGAETHQINSSSENVMFLAALSGNVELVKMIEVSNGPITSSFSQIEKEIIYDVISRGNMQNMLHVLLRSSPKNYPDSDKLNAALFEATFQLLDRLVIFCVECGADPNNHFSGFPLFIYADKGDVTMVSFLLENGAKINMKSGGKSPLGRVVDNYIQYPQEKSYKMIKLLLQNGANVDFDILQVVTARGNRQIQKLIEQYRM